MLQSPSMPEGVSSACSSIAESQLQSLDDADPYASAWSDAVANAFGNCDVNVDGENEKTNNAKVKWGGRGKGGRGLNRRTFQPYDIVVPDVNLEYVPDASVKREQSSLSSSLKSKSQSKKKPTTTCLLEGASLKLLSPKVYGLIGRNGCGKSTLLKRINGGKIPGFPLHVSCMFIPQEEHNARHNSDDDVQPSTPLESILSHYRLYRSKVIDGNKQRMEELEQMLESLDMSEEENNQKVEEICDEIARLEETNQDPIRPLSTDSTTTSAPSPILLPSPNENNHKDQDSAMLEKAKSVLRFFSIPDLLHDQPIPKLSGGLRKKIKLACALFYNPQLLLLDEPTNNLDISGMVQLRQLIEICTERNTTVVLVSHDVDLINDVTTDIIHFHNRKLDYYPGNYRDFLGYRHQQDVHQLRQAHSLDHKREQMMNTIGNLKAKAARASSTGSSAAAKKVRKTIESKKKKLEKAGIQKDEKGHRWQMQKAGTGMKEGSINGIDASTRSKLSHSQLLKRLETNVAPVPDKAVQFDFCDTTCTWGEPLIMAMDMGHGYDVTPPSIDNETESLTVISSTNNNDTKEGMLFDCVELCIPEGSRTCIVGANGCGKSTLLRILAGLEEPLEGKIQHAHNVTIGYFDQHMADNLVETFANSNTKDEKAKNKSFSTPLSLLMERFPTKTEQDLRGKLKSFGLSQRQSLTNIAFLSGGERCRLCLTLMMLKDPQVLILDEATNHLDVESVEALIYGLKKWNGTVVTVSHDANFIRSLGGTCYVIMEKEKKIRRIVGGIDAYLKVFTV